MSKHTGIKRLAEDGEVGYLIGWGYLDNNVAILNVEIRNTDGNPIIGIKCQPCDAMEIFNTCRDREIDFVYGDEGERLIGCQSLNVVYELKETP